MVMKLLILSVRSFQMYILIADCHGNGVTSAYFKHDGKIEDFMNLLILSQMKFENISEFSLIILVGISEC